MKKQERKVFFGLHFYRMPDCIPFLISFKRTLKLLKERGYTTQNGFAWGDPYIQKARNNLVKQFLESDCDIFFFVADDLEWNPEDALKVIETNGEVVAGVYPQKSSNPIKYPVSVERGGQGIPLTRPDGCISAKRVQTGFLRINRIVFENIVSGYPELAFYGVYNGKPIGMSHDFFPQGVHNHRWIGEDYAFCDLWTGLGGKIWIVPDIDFSHYAGGREYFGNYHEYLKQLPGGINENKKVGEIFTMRPGPSFSLKPLLNSISINDGRMVEIGSYTGESIEQFAKSGKFETIYAVDRWEDYCYNKETDKWHIDMDVVESLFDKRISKYNNIIKIKKSSIEAAKTFEEAFFDFIYIDADHTYESAKEDILAWMPKLKPGGIIAGHDYHLFEGVNKAVDEIFGTSVTHFPDTSWMVRR